jgi:hypothetical protein
MAAPIQYVHALIDANWTPSITGRVVDVPEPDIYIENDEDDRRFDLALGDVAVVEDGGQATKDPRSFAWTEERKLEKATVDLRTSGEAGAVSGRERLNGVRDSNNVAERYGGLAGEVERIVDGVRTGDKEFDLIEGHTFNDISAQMGSGTWRGVFEIDLDQRVTEIDPMP